MIGTKHIKQSEWLLYLDGSMVAASSFRKRGDDTTALMPQLFAGLVLNGIDFSKTASHDRGLSFGSFKFASGAVVPYGVFLF